MMALERKAWVQRKAWVRVREGLHARPATEFVKLAKSFACDLEILRDGRAANAKSSVKLMLLGVKEADEIIIRAEGADAQEAVERLAAFIETPEAGHIPLGAAAAANSISGLGFAASAPQGDASPTGRGVPASEGTALGPAFAFFAEPVRPEFRQLAENETAAEIARFRDALDNVIAVSRDASTAPPPATEQDAIIAALAELARDAEFAGAIEARIGGGLDAISATLDVGAALAARFGRIDDAYLRARAEDVRGLARAITLALSGRAPVTLAELPQGAVIVAEELSAIDLAKAPLHRVAGIVCMSGAATSHVAILARTYGIPAVLGYGGEAARLRGAARVGLDGGTGEVFLDPDEADAARLEARIAEEQRERIALDAFRSAEPRTRDGRLIEIAANLGSLNEIDQALGAGAMGVGLFRTELLFMEGKSPPSEDEQEAVYAKLASAFAPHPVIVRTLDVGGDKPVPGIDFPAEHNPFLGWRGVRMCLDRPDIFKPQLKALLRASLSGNIKIMLPMVADIEEVQRTKELLTQCRAELAERGVAFGEPELGIMIETPAAALQAADFAKEVAFFSIGTNDLAQYVMAADRLNPRVVHLNRADHPAVLAAVDLVCRAAREAGIWVGVCGEAAARPDLIATFIRMGVTELSMSPSSIPRAKKCVTEI
ncbi:phosphoenolpyruvate--protein phosphotransferase [Rhizobiales bacterium GAS113]|nr:phosphoenolpyruvate--protein phosphotransferase [Rhizobiales bacterium GAS113]